MPKSSRASLKFPPGDTVGKPYFIADFKSSDAEIYVRELVQNALDAHLASINEGGGARGPCEVRFVKRKLASKNLPDFAGYKNALEKCVKAWENKPEVQRYLQELSDRASQPEHDLLLVYDNGIGFTEESMNAILSEGAPRKHAGSSGSFGIGHLSAFGMSGLQYVLYGGKSKEGRIATGHAVLASHENSDGEPCSSCHGYYVNELVPHSLFSGYVFVQNEDIDSPISDWLEEIGEHGSVVAISDFNYFKEGRNNDVLLYEIVKAVIVNFAIAVLKDDLRVSISIESQINKEINKDNLEALIDEFELWDSEDEAVKGVLANITTFSEPEESGSLASPFGDCELMLRNDTPAHGVTIWRNGMLIKRNYRGLSRSYFNTAFFDALILLDGKSSDKSTHDLIKEAENPLHNEIAKKNIENKERRKLFTELIGATRGWLIEKAKPLSEKPITLDDLLLPNPLSKPPEETPEFVVDGTNVNIVPVRPHKKGPKPENGGLLGTEETQGKVNIKRPSIQWQSTYVEDRDIWRVRIKSDGKIDLMIFFSLHNGHDGSCKGPSNNQFLKIRQCERINGKIDSEYNENYVGLRGDKGDSCVLELTFGMEEYKIESDLAALSLRTYSKKKSKKKPA